MTINTRLSLIILLKFVIIYLHIFAYLISELITVQITSNKLDRYKIISFILMRKKNSINTQGMYDKVARSQLETISVIIHL